LNETSKKMFKENEEDKNKKQATNLEEGIDNEIMKKKTDGLGIVINEDG